MEIDVVRKTTTTALIVTMLSTSFVYAAPQALDSNLVSTTTRSADDKAKAQPPSGGTMDSTASAPVSPPSTDDQLPDSPGLIKASSTLLLTQSVPVEQETANPPDPQPQSSQSAPAPPQGSPREPQGTAAAESVPTMGVAASRPTGEALAPAKQRRVRSILIKVGAVVGVGVAVGVTMALSEGSPSRPPGAR
jgi:hypothetical protein